MKSKIIYFLKEIVIFVILLIVFVNIISIYKTKNISNSELNLTTISLIQNEQYDINNTKPLLIHIWATWCPTCRLEASNIEKISKTFQVITIAVKSGSDKEIKRYMEENNFSFKVHNDKNGSLSKKFNIPAYPTTLIYDKNKKLIFSDVGYTSTIGLYFRMLWAK